MNIRGTSAVVTGAASGLGHAVTQALSKAGADVFGIDLPAVLAQASHLDGVEYIPADITDPEQVAGAINQAGNNAPLRTVVNCAGVAPSARILRKGEAHDLVGFARTVSINLVGTYNVMALGAEQIVHTEPDHQGQRGIIINTASIAAMDGQVGQCGYASSKGGVASLTLPAARDLASFGIRVCAVAPGIMDTPMMAAFSDEVRAGLAAGVPFPQRLGQPHEFADLVLAIIGNDYLNGEVIRFDGGLRMAAR